MEDSLRRIRAAEPRNMVRQIGTAFVISTSAFYWDEARIENIQRRSEIHLSELGQRIKKLAKVCPARLQSTEKGVEGELSQPNSGLIVGWLSTASFEATTAQT